MGKIISIVNEKGGVGKTTSAVNISYELVNQGKKTLLIDFDGQGNASFILGNFTSINDSSIKTISDALDYIINKEEFDPFSVISQTKTGVDIIPANSRLFKLEKTLNNEDFRETKLKEYVDKIKDFYDYIIIDSSPQIGTPMVNVMMCSDEIIIPTQAEILSVKGLSELIKHLESIKKYGNNNVIIKGILITMDSHRTITSKQVKNQINKIFGCNIPVFSSVIPRSIKVAEASAYRKTIIEYAPKNAAAVAYQKLVGEIL